MEIQFSRHARRQIKWRRILEDEIKAVIENPDKLEDAIKGRKNAFKKVKGRLLKITFRIEDNVIIVVTAVVKEE